MALPSLSPPLTQVEETNQSNQPPKPFSHIPDPSYPVEMFRTRSLSQTPGPLIPRPIATPTVLAVPDSSAAIEAPPVLNLPDSDLLTRAVFTDTASLESFTQSAAGASDSKWRSSIWPWMSADLSKGLEQAVRQQRFLEARAKNERTTHIREDQRSQMMEMRSEELRKMKLEREEEKRKEEEKRRNEKMKMKEEERRKNEENKKREEEVRKAEEKVRKEGEKKRIEKLKREEEVKIMEEIRRKEGAEAQEKKDEEMKKAEDRRKEKEQLVRSSPIPASPPFPSYFPHTPPQLQRLPSKRPFSRSPSPLEIGVAKQEVSLKHLQNQTNFLAAQLPNEEVLSSSQLPNEMTPFSQVHNKAVVKSNTLRRKPSKITIPLPAHIASQCLSPPPSKSQKSTPKTSPKKETSTNSPGVSISNPSDAPATSKHSTQYIPNSVCAVARSQSQLPKPRLSQRSTRNPSEPSSTCFNVAEMFVSDTDESDCGGTILPRNMLSPALAHQPLSPPISFNKQSGRISSQPPSSSLSSNSPAFSGRTAPQLPGHVIDSLTSPKRFQTSKLPFVSPQKKPKKESSFMSHSPQQPKMTAITHTAEVPCLRSHISLSPITVYLLNRYCYYIFK